MTNSVIDPAARVFFLVSKIDAEAVFLFYLSIYTAAAAYLMWATDFVSF